MKKKLLSLLLSLCICTSLLTGMASAAGFTDVKSTDYYAKPVEWAVGKSITNGTSATTFSPNQTCNNAQIITFLWRAAGCPASRLYSGSFNPFFDVPDDAWYLDAAKWAMGEIVLRAISSLTPNVPAHLPWSSSGGLPAVPKWTLYLSLM